MPEPIVSREDGTDPEHEALLADSVGLALLVVLDTLAPAERLAFVLHDMFAVPFDEIAPIVGRSPTAARQLASRARRRVQGAAHGSRRRSRPPARSRRRLPRCLARRGLRRAARGARPRRRAPSRPRRRALGRIEGGPRCARPWPAGRSSAACPGRATGARERSRGRRRGSAGTAACGPRLHDQRTARSSRSTWSPTPSASATLTWRSSTADRETSVPARVSSGGSGSFKYCLADGR